MFLYSCTLWGASEGNTLSFFSYMVTQTRPLLLPQAVIKFKLENIKANESNCV